MTKTKGPLLVDGLAHLGDSGSRERIIRSRNGYLDACLRKPDMKTGPLSNLNDHFTSLAMKSFYQENSLNQCKAAAYNSAIADRMVLQDKPYPRGSAYPHKLLCPLLSDNKAIIHWYGQFFLPVLRFDFKKQPAFQVPCQAEHYTVQMGHAILGNWQQLADNCELALAESPKKRKLFQIDYAFLYALAKGDVPAMETALAELVAPKVRVNRQKELGFGLTEKLMYGWGVILAKLAWYHGYEVDVDSPWVPKELLPFKPLPDTEYHSGIDFMDDFDIFTPFEDNPDKWCKNASLFSPKPLGEALNVDELYSKLER
ncbi:MAG: hypothetical protein ACI9DG_001337 [Oleispira sp.]|jgi:hypothetical protein